MAAGKVSFVKKAKAVREVGKCHLKLKSSGFEGFALYCFRNVRGRATVGS
jgi:hypothetical protein